MQARSTKSNLIIFFQAANKLNLLTANRFTNGIVAPQIPGRAHP